MRDLAPDDSASKLLRTRPSLPSLLSHTTSKGHVSLSTSPLPSPRARAVTSSFFPLSTSSPASSIREGTSLFTDDAASVDDSLDNLSIEPKGKARQEDARDVLRKQLEKNQSQQHKLLRRSSASTVISKTSRRASPSRTSIEVTEDDSLRTITKRRYFVLSSAGKPVYASDSAADGADPSSDEIVSSHVGVMQAIISIFIDDGDRIKYIDAGANRIAFFLRQQLYYVAVSDWGEPESVLRTQLDYLHSHILSVVSQTQLTRIFAHRDNFDLRRLLQGTDKIVANLVDALQTDLGIMTASLDVLKLKPDVRADVSKCVEQTAPESKDILYAIVLCARKIVTLLRPARHTAHPIDLHLLVNTIYSTPSLVQPGNESWIPICLPRFNSSGFLHVLVSFITKEIGLVIVSTDKEAFFMLREWKEAIASRLKSGSNLKSLHYAALHSDYSPGDLAIPGLRHFVYKRQGLGQITFPRFEGDYTDERQRIALITLYQRIHDQLHIRLPMHGQGRQPAKLIYLRTTHECVVGYIMNGYELLMSMAPLLGKDAVASAAQCVARWVNARQAELFLIEPPVLNS